MTQHGWSQAARRHANVGHFDANAHDVRRPAHDPRPEPGRKVGAWNGGTLLDVVPLPETGKVMMIVAHVVPAPSAEPSEEVTEASAAGESPRVDRTSGRVRAAGLDAYGPAAEGLCVDHASRRVWVDGREVGLTYQEFALLDHLTAHPWTVFSRAELMTTLWPDAHGATRTVDVHVHRLRRKLGGEGRRLATVRRVGYVYRPEQNA